MKAPTSSAGTCRVELLRRRENVGALLFRDTVGVGIGGHIDLVRVCPVAFAHSSGDPLPGGLVRAYSPRRLAFFTKSAIFIRIVKNAPMINIGGRFEPEALRIMRAIPGLDVIAEPERLRSAADAVVRFAGTEEYVAIEFKTRVNAAAAWQFVHVAQHRFEFPLILIAAETTSDARRILTEHGIAFIDGLGNVHLELPGLLLHIAGTGRPTRPLAPSRLSGKAGLIAQALLLDPERGVANQGLGGADWRLDWPHSPCAVTP